MEVKDLASLRRTRAIRKRKLTIALNELNDELKEEDVVPEQICQLIEKCKTRLDAVETAHDVLLEAITEEEEFPQEEQWLALVVKDFNKLTRAGRKILSNVGKIKPIVNQIEEITPVQAVEDSSSTIVNVNDSIAKDSTVSISDSVNETVIQKGKDDVVNTGNRLNVDNVLNTPNTINVTDSGSTITNTNENSILSMVQAMALPKAHVKKFDGDPLFYYTFMASFHNSVSCITDSSIKLNVLRSLCCGRALDATEFCILKPPAEGLKAALSTLKQRFGNSAVIVQAWIQKILSRPKVEPAKLESYADDLTNCYQALDALGYIHELNNQGSLKTIIEKLPKFLQQRWTREVFKLRENDKIPGLKDVVKFVRSSSCEINDPVYGTASEAHKPLKSSERTSGHVFQTETHITADNRMLQKWKKCWGCQTDDHWPDQCRLLIGLTPNFRLKRAKENHVCFSCFKKAGKAHSMANCRRKRKCTHCEQFHHPLLHQTTQTQQLMTLAQTEADIVMPMITANVSGRSANVLFDTCTTLTLIRDDLAKECNFPSKPITVEITTLGSEKSLLHTRAYSVNLTSKEGSSHTLTAIGVPHITDVPKIANTLRADFEGRLGEPIHRGSGSVDILIGVNYAKMHTGRCFEMRNYVARKSPLGWVVFGTNANSTSQQQNPVLLVNLAEPVDISKFWSTEEMGVRCECSCKEKDSNLSPDDRAKFNEMWDSCKKGNHGHWVVPYPWIKPPESLCNNERQCFAKLCSLEKRLQKTPGSAEQYDKAINDLVGKGFAKKLTQEEKSSYYGPVHYIPHHAIIRLESTSTPVRIVFNSSNVFEGSSLNDHWSKGPDLLQNLMGVIMRFREFKVAIAGDISKMFNQVKIPLRDMHVHRFLWRNFQQRSPDTYVLTTVTPGDKPAPSMAITALLRTAEENKSDYPQAAKTLKHDTYMDDICTSVKDEASATMLTKQIDQVLSTAKFKVKRWVSNVTANGIQDSMEQTVMSDNGEQKVLGVVWEPRSDNLKYKVEQNEVTSKLTKRTVLSEISKIFDPIGFAGPFLIRAKIMMQRLWTAGVGWDEELSSDEKTSWLKFFEEMKSLHGVAFQRCLIPEPDAQAVELIIFCDASESAFGAVCYTRWVNSDGLVGVRFLTARSRVAPLKTLSIPRLELQAAVLAARLYTSVTQEMAVKFGKAVFLSDSIIALSWIRGQSRQYKPFVANRVAEIQRTTDPSDWKHIPGEFNIADKISRGVSVTDLQGDWKDGPPFLKLSVDDWPRSIPKANEQAVDIEKKKVQNVMLIQEHEEPIDVNKYSSWRRLVRVTAYVFRFITNAKAKCCVDDGPLSAHELTVAERHWLVKAQKSLKELKDYKSLSPFQKNDIIQLGGRTSNKRLSYDQAYPVRLPRNHPISYLITKHVHETGHYGVATTAAKVQQRFWIVQGTALAKTVKYRCTTCRVFEHKTENQFMSDLPLERVTPYSPPFYYTSCDYFGPYHVKISRNKTTKHYGVIFTCLVTRAVHLELAVDCSTQEFIQVLRRFCSIRGRPNLLQSDNGMQFVGAARELRNMIAGWDKTKLKEYCESRMIQMMDRISVLTISFLVDQRVGFLKVHFVKLRILRNEWSLFRS